MPKRAVLLVNLGSPASTSVADVRRYLHEFLGDERVIDRPANPFRWLLVHGLIVPLRAPKSAHAYASIWKPGGSPLVLTSQAVSERLRSALANDMSVFLAMRYGEPSIQRIVSQIANEGFEEVLIFPQYPHYAMSSWETVVVKVQEEFAKQAAHIRIDCVQPFFADPDYIHALYESALPYLQKPHDFLLFSYHGIPVRHLTRADSSHGHCCRVTDCCYKVSPAHATCYKAQVLATTRAFVKLAKLDATRFAVSFQSRLVGEPWLSPYTDQTLVRLANDGVRNLIVITPAFVVDCLETLEEIAEQGKSAFIKAGGTSFVQIPCLNDHPAYIDFLASRCHKWNDTSRQLQ